MMTNQTLKLMTPTLLAAALATVVGASTAWAGPISASLVGVKGLATVTRADGAQQQAEKGMKLRAGDRIKTGVNSNATIEWGGGNTASILSLTSMKIDELKLDEKSGAGVSRLYSDRGRVVAHAGKLKTTDSQFVVQTPTATAGVRGTSFAVEVSQGGATKVSTFSGEVAASSGGKTVSVKGGQTAGVDSKGNIGKSEPISVRQAESLMEELKEVEVEGAAGAEMEKVSGYLEEGVSEGGFEEVEMKETGAAAGEIGEEGNREEEGDGKEEKSADSDADQKESSDAGEESERTESEGKNETAQTADASSSSTPSANSMNALPSAEPLQQASDLFNGDVLGNMITNQILVESSESLNAGF